MKTKEGAIRIFEALSSVDEELLLRSEGEQKVVPFWRYAKVMAACICFVVVGVVAISGSRLIFTGSQSADNAAPAAMEEKAMDSAADNNGSGMEAAQAEMPAEAPAEAMVAEETKMDVVEEAAAEEGVQTEDVAGATSEETQNQMSADLESEMISDCGPLPEQSVILSLEELKLVETFGDYVPAQVPAGYVFAEGSVTASGDSISARWENGMDTISISVSYYEDTAENDARIIDISKPETYDVHLYEIPYAQTVPDEFRSAFNNPIFRGEDLSLEVIAARMKSVSDMGDTDTPRGRFAVLYDDGVYVSFNGRGDAESIWKMFESLGKE